MLAIECDGFMSHRLQIGYKQILPNTKELKKMRFFDTKETKGTKIFPGDVLVGERR